MCNNFRQPCHQCRSPPPLASSDPLPTQTSEGKFKKRQIVARIAAKYHFIGGLNSDIQEES